MKKYADKCPRCGGQVVVKSVQEIVYHQNDTAFITVESGVCLHCGERLYTPETIRYLEKIETKLADHEIKEFIPVGRSYQVPA